MLAAIERGKRLTDGPDSELYQIFKNLKLMLNYKAQDPTMNRRRRLEAIAEVSRECVRLYRLWSEEQKEIQAEHFILKMDELERIITRLDERNPLD